MKKILLFAVLIIPVYLFSQTELPKKMTKGIEVTIDDFNGGITYKAKGVGLSVLSKSDGCVFTWVLNCSDLTPVSFSKVLILANGKVEDIPFTENEYNEYAETRRVGQNTFSGGKVATTFVNQDVYIAEIKLDASNYIELLENIISDSNDVKVRFSGNKDINGAYNKKAKTEIRTILNIYKTLSGL